MKFQLIRYGLVLLFGVAFLAFHGQSPEVSNAVCLVLILLFGIPHGAVDHHIHATTSNDRKVFRYVLQYVLIAAVYVIWWMFDPTKALILFLLLSAYHFGQEALEDAHLKKPKALDSMIWGIFILIAPILFSFSDVRPYLEIITSISIPELPDSMAMLIAGISISSVGFYLLVRLRSGSLDQANAKRLGLFALTLILLHAFLPFVLAFTLYFVFFHSLNAFNHQFSWLKNKKKSYSLKRFILDLAGFSLIAIVGIVLLLWAIDPRSLDSLISYFFILTSLITLPHAITLDQFYRFKRSRLADSQL